MSRTRHGPHETRLLLSDDKRLRRRSSGQRRRHKPLCSRNSTNNHRLLHLLPNNISSSLLLPSRSISCSLLLLSRSINSSFLPLSSNTSSSPRLRSSKVLLVLARSRTLLIITTRQRPPSTKFHNSSSNLPIAIRIQDIHLSDRPPLPQAADEIAMVVDGGTSCCPFGVERHRVPLVKGPTTTSTTITAGVVDMIMQVVTTEALWVVALTISRSFRSTLVSLVSVPFLSLLGIQYS